MAPPRKSAPPPVSRADTDIPQPAIKSERGKGANTVIVACKIPAGLKLQLCRKVEYVEEGLGGTRINRVRFDKFGKTYNVRGPAQPNGEIPKGYRRPEVEGGYALTYGIPADFWQEWAQQNADAPYMQSEMIFAYPDRDDAIGQSADREHILSGFEPLKQTDDPRVPKSLNPDISDIGKANIGASERAG